MSTLTLDEVSESLWIRERQAYIMAAYESVETVAKVTYYHQKGEETQATRVTSHPLPTLPVQLTRPYSSWLSRYPTYSAETTSAKLAVLFLEEGCLGAALRESDAAQLFREVEDPSSVVFRQLKQLHCFAVARRGPLESYWPLKQMDELADLVEVYQPDAWFLPHWRDARPGLAEAWKEEEVLNWLIKGLEDEHRPKNKQSQFLTFLTALIQGVPFDYLLLGQTEVFYAMK